MSTVQEIEAAITKLAPEDVVRLRQWLDEYEANQWDEQIASDMESGALDALADEALRDLDEGRCTDR